MIEFKSQGSPLVSDYPAPIPSPFDCITINNTAQWSIKRAG
jgi:hypothetical protein